MIAFHQENATVPFLAWQIRETETRQMISPVYDRLNRYQGDRIGPDSVQVFRLLGYGETFAAACRRANMSPSEFKRRAACSLPDFMTS